MVWSCVGRKISVCQGFLDTTAGIASKAQSEVQNSTQIHATIAQAQQPSGPWAAAGKRRCRPKRSRARLAWGGSSPGSHSARFSGTHLIYGIGAEIGRTLDFGKASQPEVTQREEECRLSSSVGRLEEETRWWQPAAAGRSAQHCLSLLLGGDMRLAHCSSKPGQRLSRSARRSVEEGR